jgi:hypothetical protein
MFASNEVLLHDAFYRRRCAVSVPRKAGANPIARRRLPGENVSRIRIHYCLSKCVAASLTDDKPLRRLVKKLTTLTTGNGPEAGTLTVQELCEPFRRPQQQPDQKSGMGTTALSWQSSRPSTTPSTTGRATWPPPRSKTSNTIGKRLRLSLLSKKRPEARSKI